MTRLSRTLLPALTAALLGSTFHAASAQETIKIADVIELSGTGATVGTLWRNAVTMAVDDINAKGGVLGHKLEVADYDTQTNPGVSRAVLQKALDTHPYAVVGPIYSGSVKVDEPLTQAAKLAQITGAEAPDITQLNDPYIFRTSFSQLNAMPRVARYIADELHAKKVAVFYVNDDFGKGGHDAILKEFAARKIDVTADIASEAGQASFTSDVLKAKRSGADAFFVFLHEEESARFLKEARNQGIKVPLVGETTLMNAQSIALAGDAANGVTGHVGLTADAPVPGIQDFVKRYTARYHQTPDHNALKGYMAVWMIKAATEKMGKLDAEHVADTLHGMTITPDTQPGIMMPTTILPNGDIDRESFLVKVEDGHQTVIQILPKLGS
jgi:branched-chain amino acid transport system substrate-binding protein